jgi:hypothetical protein
VEGGSLSVGRGEGHCDLFDAAVEDAAHGEDDPLRFAALTHHGNAPDSAQQKAGQGIGVLFGEVEAEAAVREPLVYATRPSPYTSLLK